MELTTAWQCQKWHCLPEPGGLRDQRAGEVQRMTIVLNVWEAWYAWKHRKGGDELEFKNKHPEWWDLVLKVEEMRHG